MLYFQDKKFKLLDIKVSRLVDSNFLGNYKTAIKGHGIEFADIRKYNSGDSYKSIDWISSAKKGKLYIKRYEEERQLSILFLIDIGGSMQFGLDTRKIDTMLEVFYILALSALRNNDRIGAVLYDNKVRKFINPAKGKTNLLKILNSIQSLSQSSDQYKSETETAIDYLNKNKIKRKLVFVLTDDGNINKVSTIKMAGLKNEMIYINIFDNFENTLESDNKDINLVNGGKHLELNLNDGVKKLEYKQLRQSQLNEFKHLLISNGINYILIDNKTNIFTELLKLFQLKALRKF